MNSRTGAANVLFDFICDADKDEIASNVAKIFIICDSMHQAKNHDFFSHFEQKTNNYPFAPFFAGRICFHHVNVKRE